MIRRAACLSTALILAACTGSTNSERPPDSTPSTASTVAPPATSITEPATDPAIDLDPRWRTTPDISSIAAFEQLSKLGVGGQQVVKFSITDFFGEPHIEWLDSSFYELHDEWFWFRLLNGAAIPGLDVDPLALGEAPVLDDIDAAYTWAEARSDRLPLDLRITSLGRLYSPQFYDLALDDPNDRPLALGSIIRVPGDSERWLLELEYRDAPTPAHIERYLDIVAATLPEAIGGALLWVPRSREQELTAEEMAADALPYGDRTIRFDDLVEPGTVEVYSPGLAAGRLLLVTDDGRYSLGDAGPDDIVVVQRTPDALPPGNALITGTPQTPLAHVNVLALNRGIPNVFLGGLVDNAELSQLGRVRAPVAVKAVAQPDGPGLLDIRALTDAEFREWNGRRRGTRISVPSLDWSVLPLTYDLDALTASAPLTEADLREIRPVIGGKSAGFLGLLEPNRSAADAVATPDRPLAVTVRPYFEHIAPLAATIEAMLRSSSFDNSSRARMLVLEGPDDFADQFDADADTGFIDDFVVDEADTVLGQIVAAGGLKQMIRDLPIDPTTLDALDATLRTQFEGFDSSQGLRFRSSSSVEDIEGFNGAGLYSSNTGYLDPAALPDADDHKRTIERALKRTWSSYWNMEAVEERRFENVNHVSGGMGVLVHARFDDPLEISNGVATFTLLPDTSPDVAVMRLNVQAGATSVTNPETADDGSIGPAPEVVEVRLSRSSTTPTVVRIAPSTLTDTEVLSDADLLDVWRQLDAVTQRWLARINASRPDAQHDSTLTLDFEFRQMDAQWPAGDSRFERSGARVVVKQARTLEPGLRALPAPVIDLDIPRSVLARASRIDRVTCPGSDPTSAPDERVEVLTDPLATVDLGYADTPFVLPVTGNVSRLEGPECIRTSLFASASDYLAALFAERTN